MLHCERSLSLSDCPRGTLSVGRTYERSSGVVMEQLVAGPFLLAKESGKLAPGLLTVSACLAHIVPDAWTIEWAEVEQAERLARAAEFGIDAIITTSQTPSAGPQTTSTVAGSPGRTCSSMPRLPETFVGDSSRPRCGSCRCLFLSRVWSPSWPSPLHHLSSLAMRKLGPSVSTKHLRSGQS